MQIRNRDILLRWLYPEILLGLPGDYFVGFFLAAVKANTPTPNLVACGIYLLILICCIASLFRTYRRATFGFSFWSGSYRLLAVLVGGACSGVLVDWAVAIAAILLGLYGFACGRVFEISRNSQHSRLGYASPLIWVVSLACSLYALTAAFGEHHFGLGFWCVAWLAVWFMARTFYFCHALKGYNAPRRIAQGGGLFLRGMLLLQGMMLTAFLPGMQSLAAFIAVFVLINIQTIACKFIKVD